MLRRAARPGPRHPRRGETAHGGAGGGADERRARRGGALNLLPPPVGQVSDVLAGLGTTSFHEPSLHNK